MAQTSKIEWTDVTWNPVHGCSKVSPGCAHCYAETLSLRYSHTTRPWTPENAEVNVMLKPHKLREPLSKAKPWDRPCMVFVNSMSDLFHEQIPVGYIRRVFETMRDAPRHTFQVLTKRPERMRAIVSDPEFWTLSPEPDRPLPNVWLGVSIENRRFVGRADALRETPAAVRFISAEPLLGPLVYDDAEVSREDGSHEPCWAGDYRGAELDLVGIDWLIVGGESGPGHRPMRLEWARDLVAAARAAGCAPFVKQLGGARPGTALEDLPEDLRIREFPAVA